MKTLQNNFTTPEQSRRLLELGVPAWTADCYFYEEGGISYDAYPEVVPFGEVWTDGSKETMFSSYVDLPCWSVGRLMEIFIICTPYTEIRLRTRFIEQLIASFEDVIKQGMIDFSKLEEPEK